MSAPWDVRFVNETHHLCGCVTRFDVIDWRSVAVKRCEEHLAVSRASAGSSSAVDPESNPSSSDSAGGTDG